MQSVEPYSSEISEEISIEPRSNLSVLQELFPALDTTALQRALDDHSGVVPAAVETLLRSNSQHTNKRKAKLVSSGEIKVNSGDRSPMTRINQWAHGVELSSKLKLEQLQQQFPNIDREILTLIFAENNFNVANTMRCLNSIYGLDDKSSANSANVPNLDNKEHVKANSSAVSDTCQKSTRTTKEVQFKTVTYKKSNSLVPGPKKSRDTSQSSTTLRQKIHEQMHVIQQSIWARNQYFQSACS